MADVDDELLALVGGDESSDDEGSEQAMNISKSESGSPEPEEKNSAKKASGKKPKKDYSDEEEGEASSDAASVASQESAPMDESDSDAASAAGGNMLDDEENKYPFEGMYTNEEEKEHIQGLREVERESILAERMHEIELQRQNRLLRQLVSQNESDKKAAKKRKANDAELEEAQRKTSRQRTKVGGAKVGETSSGIESLRRARAERQDRKRRFDEDRERNKDKNASAARDSPDDENDRENDSDLEWDGRNRRSRSSHTPEVKESPPAELRDVERVRLSRSRFAQICFFPGFESAMKGCFVRLCIGPDAHGANVYRMAVIKDFATGKPYAMEKPNGQSFVTDQYVVAAHGKAEREWPFIACSESEFTEAEFNRYKVTAQAEGVAFPKKSMLNDKIDDINKLRNRSWTDRELDEKLQRERELRKMFAPTERNRLANSIEEAKARGDHEKADQLQQKLDSLETPRLAFRTSLTPNKKASPAVSQQDRLAQLNAENRRRNAEEVRKAQLKEKAKAREGTGDATRRQSAQRKDSTPASNTPTPANGTPKLDVSTSKPIPPHIAQLQQNQSANQVAKGIPQIHRPLVDDDIIGALDLEIDVEID